MAATARLLKKLQPPKIEDRLLADNGHSMRVLAYLVDCLVRLACGAGVLLCCLMRVVVLCYASRAFCLEI